MNSFRRLLAIVSLLIAITTISFALKAEYRFEKCDGSASVENHVSSLLVGDLHGDANISLGDGKIKNALTLSGDGMMSVEHSDELDIVGDLTISFWVKPSQIKKQALVTRGFGTGTGRKYGSNAEYFIKIQPNGQLAYRHNYVESSGSVIAYSDTNLTVDEWTHVVFVRDNSAKTMRFYINGVANSEYLYATDPKSSHTEKLIIGQCDGCVNPDNFSGKLDEIKIYSIALSEGDILALYNSENGGDYSTGGCHPAPLASNDSADLPFDGTTTIDILSNDRTNDSATCSVDASTVMIRSNPTDSNLSEDNKTLIVNSEGCWSVESSGSLKFVSLDTFKGNPTDINYTVSDSCGNLSNRATVSLTRVANSSNNNSSSGGGYYSGSNYSNGGGSSLGGSSSSSSEEDKNITLGDRVWYDIDKDGIQDSGERGVNNVTVVLFDTEENVVKKTTTNTDGIYQFCNIVAGTYSIGFSNLPTNYIFTSQDMGSSDAKDSDVDSSGRTAEFTVGNVENDLIYDAGLVLIIDNTTIHPSIDDNTTTVLETCKCDDYKSTIPSMNVIGLIAIWLLVSLLGVIFLRGDDFNFNKK